MNSDANLAKNTDFWGKTCVERLNTVSTTCFELALYFARHSRTLVGTQILKILVSQGVFGRKKIRLRNSASKFGPDFKNQFFLVVYALRRQDFEYLGSHQGPWTPCKVLSEFKVFCRNGVQTNAIFFEGAETDIWDSTPFNCRWRTWLGHCARCNCNFMYSNIVWKQSTHIEFIELKLN